jgi:hypothetical protein
MFGFLLMIILFKPNKDIPVVIHNVGDRELIISLPKNRLFKGEIIALLALFVNLFLDLVELALLFEKAGIEFIEVLFRILFFKCLG